MGVPHPEQRIALTLHQVVGGDPGPVVRSGVEQGPPGGVGPERRGVLRCGHGPQIDGLAVLHGGPAALGPHDAYDGVGDGLGPHLVRHPERDDLPGEGVTVSVPGALLPDLRDQRGHGVDPLREPDVEEPRPGDDDVLDPVGPDETFPQDPGDVPRGLPGGGREPQRDGGGEVPAPPGPGSVTTTRSGTATLSSPSPTARHTASNTVRDSSAGVTGQA